MASRSGFETSEPWPKRLARNSRVAAERRQEARRRIRIVARLCHDADADLVRVKLLLARETRERAPFDRFDFFAFLAAFDHRRGLADQRGALFLLRPQRRMPRGDMADLMRHHGGDLRRIVGQRQEPARDIDVVGRHREGIDHRRIQKRHMIGLLRIFARLRQFQQDVIDEMLDGRVVIFAAEGATIF